MISLIVYFLTVTMCMLIGQVFLILLHKEFKTSSYAVGVFSATVATLLTTAIQ